MDKLRKILGSFRTWRSRVSCVRSPHGRTSDERRPKRYMEPFGSTLEKTKLRMWIMKTIIDEKAKPRMANPHPGDFIRTEIIEALELSVTAAARILGVSRPALSTLLNARANLSGEMALRIEKAFGPARRRANAPLAVRGRGLTRAHARGRRGLNIHRLMQWSLSSAGSANWNGSLGNEGRTERGSVFLSRRSVRHHRHDRRGRGRPSGWWRARV
jgi:addiction module HigA family antidote